jgi:protein-disulfide isomerase
LKKIITAIAILIALTGNAIAETSAINKQQIEETIRNYLMENPSVIVDALEKYREQHNKRKTADQARAIKKYSDYIYSEKRPYAGNPEGDVTVVEFFDYNCGYCRKALKDILEILDSDKNVRFVFIEAPILNRASDIAASWALAAREQGEYFEFHKKIMQHKGYKSENTLRKIASDIGLDVSRLRRDAEKEATEKEINKNLRISMEVGVRGTPAFIIDGNLHGGYMDVESLKELIKEARKQNN